LLEADLVGAHLLDGLLKNRCRAEDGDERFAAGGSEVELQAGAHLIVFAPVVVEGDGDAEADDGVSSGGAEIEDLEVLAVEAAVAVSPVALADRQLQAVGVAAGAVGPEAEDGARAIFSGAELETREHRLQRRRRRCCSRGDQQMQRGLPLLLEFLHQQRQRPAAQPVEGDAVDWHSDFMACLAGFEHQQAGHGGVMATGFGAAVGGGGGVENHLALAGVAALDREARHAGGRTSSVGQQGEPIAEGLGVGDGARGGQG